MLCRKRHRKSQSEICEKKTLLGRGAEVEFLMEKIGDSSRRPGSGGLIAEAKLRPRERMLC